MNYRSLAEHAVAACIGIGVQLAATNDSAAYIDCTCTKFGSAVCIPDPRCANESATVVLDAGKEIERIIRDAGRNSERATQDTGKIIDKAVQDAGKVIEKAARETKERTPSVRILASGYSLLTESGKEEAGYGLYSYIVLTSGGDRSAALLGEVFKSIPAIEDTVAERNQLNIIYIPMKKEAVQSFAQSAKELEAKPKELGQKFLVASSYDHKMAHAILNHLCNPPAEAIRELCLGDMSRGPYIFTYAGPASSLEPVPAPYLLLDLSDVDPRAFGEFVSAFRAQVKREDIADGVRINSLRLRLLQIALKAGDLVGPVRKAIGDIVHTPGSEDKASK
jgi:hypothetical protein